MLLEWCILAAALCGRVAGMPWAGNELPLTIPEPPVFPDPGSSWTAGGTVTAVDRSSITIAVGAQLIWSHPRPGEDPIPCAFPRIIPGSREPRRFMASAPLALGGIAYRWLGDSRGYRLSDVRVGDVVLLDSYRINGVDMCRNIEISRRPGGRIPPVPGERADGYIPYHIRRQAVLDWGEKGIPIPEKYRPYIRSDRLPEPFPPAAPPPREAMPKTGQ